MDSIERNTRLLASAYTMGLGPVHPDHPREWARLLAAAGLTLALVEPDDETIERMAVAICAYERGMSADTARAIMAEFSQVARICREKARAAYRAGVGEK